MPCGQNSAEFHSKNNFENSVHVVGFIISIYHDARSPERQTVSVLTQYTFMELTGNLSSRFMYSPLIYHNQNWVFLIHVSLCRVTRLLANQKPISNWSNLEKDPTQPFSKVIASKYREFN